ncbi:NAD-dependent histone deacetylase HST3 [Leucoagaricus sp. SymC.cos]|nr:NAD-dependent histone deacetylase HST3 [Leucoagaricus sp. SymC.cos]
MSPCSCRRLSSQSTTALFCQMIADLYRLSQAAEPTPFHHILRALNDHGKLLRIYMQNVNTIEQKTGLSFGVRTLRNVPESNLENIMSQPGVKRRLRSQTSCRSEGWQSSCSDPALEAPMKVLYLNLDFPMPMREWQRVFNIWVQGDVQQFPQLLQDEIDQQAKANQLFVPRKRKREAEHELAL